MVVEDEVITQRLLGDILKQQGAEVNFFDNAVDALANISDYSPDMILMDININGAVDGIQLSRKILEKHDVPIIFITAHDDDETVEETLDLSPYGFISKPFTGKDVVISIRIASKMYRDNDQVKSVATELDPETVVINDKYTYVVSQMKLFEFDKPVELTRNQNKLLFLLVKNINMTVNYELLISNIWGEEEKSDSALRTLVYSIRKSLPDLPIVSHSKVGYSLKREK